jgi:hypothetical protein
VNGAVRKILRNYSTGMGIEYKEIVAHYQALSQVNKGRALMQMKALEESWQQELRARAQAKFWPRLWARIKSRVNAWRLAG